MKTKTKQNFLMQLFGKHYKWIYIILFYRNAQLAYRANSIFHSVSSVISFLAMLFIWWVGFSSTGNSQEFNNILTYFFVLYIYSGLTPMWISEMLGYKIQGGNLTSIMLTPTDIYWISVCEMLGRGLLTASILIILPFGLMLPFFYSMLVTPTSIFNYLGIISFIPITFIIRFSIDYIMGCSAFWLTTNGGLINLYGNINSILDGMRIPFKYLNTLIPFVAFLPTAFVLHYPVTTFQNFNQNEFFKSYFLGIVWCFALYFLANFVFKLGLKRNEAVGL
jgi:ABC-2 type transport system permease protein